MRMVLAILLCALAVVPAPADTSRQTRTFEWRPGRSLALEITNGQVRLEGGSRDDVEIAIERKAPTAEALASLPVEISETPQRVDIRIVQGGGRTDAALTSDVVIRMPSTANVDHIRIGEGGLKVSGFRGSLAAEVRRGPIEATDVSGTLRLETSIGSVTLTNARLDPRGLFRLRAFNGDVRLQMPEPPTDARILALALNGTIQSDVPMTTKDTWGPRWSEATLGKGEPVISIDVVTGTIEIRTKGR